MRKDIYKHILLCLATFGISVISLEASAGCTKSLTSDNKFNTCIGTDSLKFNSAWANTSFGYQSLYANTSGYSNVANGGRSLYSNTTGSYNIAIGDRSMMSNTIGNNNTTNGAASLWSNTRGNNNTAIGMFALSNNSSGSNNVALGYQAGNNVTTGSNNIDIGNEGVSGDSSTIRIGTLNTHTRTFIAGIQGVTVSGGAAVYVKSDGQLGTVTSSRRYKEDIQPMGDVSNRLMSLQPVTFRYKEADSAGNKPIQYGLIAEDVDLVMPEIVVRNEDGLPETVAYHVLPSLLLNEYQKQYRKLTKAESDLNDARLQIEVMKIELAKMKQNIENLIADHPKANRFVMR